ncbi:hypothetical protein HXX76_013536 [Chlamydomonas incerta]|uniref:Major facilitator superfamily associated domain-containing protein n=1 Tax=Chlamydomonas incerta TaxID=51695 RepID=A0A835SEV5_CHLIN|nr:hypothetical protein HXX76_013536 [Chlamydomonas incerta]|eukprot:KAG2425694.1 hypothetical protein HXX76_013536 [Chlamydomonas incerta]
MVLAKGWYLFSAGGAVFLLPYLYPFISSKGFSDPQIGLLAAVRPWLAAVAAMTGPALADKFNCHRAMMVATFVASILLRASIYYAAEAQYLVLFTVVIVSEYLAAPPGVLADAAVVALCSRREGASYGRQRLWGSIGWGGLSFAAGVLLDGCGYGAGFAVYLALSAPCIYVLARFGGGSSSSSSGSSGSSSSGGSSSGSKGRAGSSRGGKAGSMHGSRGQEGEGAGEEEGEGRQAEAQLSAWPAALAAGSALHEEALLPHAHEPFPFIRALVRTISGVPPAQQSPPSTPPSRRCPASPRPQAPCCSQGGGGDAYQQPGGAVPAPLLLPPPVLVHLSTPFGYEEAQYPHGGAPAVAVPIPAANAEAAEEAVPALAASDGSSQGGGCQRYSMMKLSSSVENWIQRSETWIQQREREREAAAAAAVAAAGGGDRGTAAGAVNSVLEVRAGAFLGSPAVSGRYVAAACDAAAAAVGAATTSEEEQDLLLSAGSVMSGATAATSSNRHTAAAGPAGVHLVANIRRGPSSSAAAGSAAAAAGAAVGASPSSVPSSSVPSTYHIHVSARAAPAATPLNTQPSKDCGNCKCECGGLEAAGKPQQLPSADTLGHLESIALGSSKAASTIDDSTAPQAARSSKRQQQRGTGSCAQKSSVAPSGGAHGGARNGGGRGRTSSSSGDGGGGGGFLRRVGRLLSDGAVWLFLAKVFLLGFGTGTIGTWLFIYVSSLGATHALQGLMLTMNCVAEVPVFFFQEAVSRRFPAGAVLHVATGSLVLRLAAYVALPALPSPWFVLPVELMQGLTFALSWGTCCVHCKAIAPEGLQATMQGLWQAVFNGLASGAGGLVGAVLHDRLGGRAMFAITAALILVGWLLLAAAEGVATLVAARRRHRAGSSASDECVHLMKHEEEDSGGRRAAGGGGPDGRTSDSARRQCEVVVPVAMAAATAVADDEKRALLAGGGGGRGGAGSDSQQMSSAPMPGRAGSGRGQAARALGKAAAASVSYVLRLALAGAWRHGFHAASAAAAATASATAAAPGKAGPHVTGGYSSTGGAVAPAGPPSYDDVAADMSHGGLLYGFFTRRRTASIGGSGGGLAGGSGGGAGNGPSSPKQSLLSQWRDGRGGESTGGSGSSGGDGSRRGVPARGGSAAALLLAAGEARLAAGCVGGAAGGVGGLERASSDVAFDGGRDQGPGPGQGRQGRLMGGGACGGAAPAVAACCAGVSGSSGSSSGGSSGGSGMLDALGLAAAAASPPVLPASPATAWL